MTDFRLASHQVPSELLDLAEPEGGVSFPSARGNKKLMSPLNVDFVRELEESDISAVIVGAPARPVAPVVRELKESHHKLAQLMCEGLTNAEVSLLSGYSETYIARIVNDPLFQGLIEQYGKLTEVKFRDTIEKMDSVGRDALNELQVRLADAPEQFANRELVEIVDSMITKPKAASNVSSAQSAAIAAPTINISFRTPKISPDVVEVEILK